MELSDGEVQRRAKSPGLCVPLFTLILVLFLLLKYNYFWSETVVIYSPETFNKTTILLRLQQREPNFSNNNNYYHPVDFEDLYRTHKQEEILLYNNIELFLPPTPGSVPDTPTDIMDTLPSFIRDHFQLVEFVFGKPFSSIQPVDIPEGYHTPTELYDNFQAIATEYSSIAMLINLTNEYQLPLTVDGNSIFALKLSDNVADDEDEPNYLIVSNHHARELMTPEIALDTAQQFTQNYESNATYKNILDNNQVYIIWTLNPDGLNFVWSNDNMWRKNRRDNGDGSHGVDLNRNYPFGWDFSCGGSTIRYSETYRGPSAASEIEVQTMRTFQLDRQFDRVLDYHSYAMDVRPNYAECAYLPALISSEFQQIATEIAYTTLLYTKGQSCCTGGNIGDVYFNYGSLAILIESGTSFQPPTNVMEKEVLDVRPMTMYFLQYETPLYGHVFDENNEPLKANLAVPQFTWYYGESWMSNARGRYSLWIPPGEWEVQVYLEGFLNSTQTVTVTPYFSTELNFTLTSAK